MKDAGLSDDLLSIIRIVKEKGGTDCSGSCHHRLPGELHCHTLARMLNISSSGIKERLLRLLNMGLLERQKIDRGIASPLTRFTVSPEGEKVLASYPIDS